MRVHVPRASRVGMVYGSMEPALRRLPRRHTGSASARAWRRRTAWGRGRRGAASPSAPPLAPPNTPQVSILQRRQRSLSRCASPWGGVSTSRSTPLPHGGGGGPAWRRPACVWVAAEVWPQAFVRFSGVHWLRAAAYILESFEAAPPVTLATRSAASSVLSSSSCFMRSALFLVRSS